MKIRLRKLTSDKDLSAREIALKAHERGYAVVPHNPRNLKPTVKWAPLRDKRPTRAEVDRMFRKGEVPGLICGLPDSRLIAIDIDDPQADPEFVLRLRGAAGYIERAPSGRKHLLFTVPKRDLLRYRTANPGTGIELKGAGSLARIAPCKGYAITKGGLANIRDIPRALGDELLGKMSGKRKSIFAGAAQGGRNTAAAREAGRLLKKLDGDEEMAHAAFVKWRERCSPPLTKQEAEQVFASIVKRQEEKSDGGHNIPIELLAREIEDGHSFARDAGNRLYVYRGGAYHDDGEDVVRGLVQDILLSKRGSWSNRKAAEVAIYIRDHAQHLWEKPPLDRICVQNGILVLDEKLHVKRLEPHNPEWLSPIQINAAYDPDATCPEIDRFINDVLYEHDRRLAYELAAWLMTPFMGIQKAVLLLGPGGNGKGRYIAMLTTFLGEKNVSTSSLQSLCGRFGASALVGKIANLMPDMPSVRLEDSAQFRSITGGDRIAAEHKFGRTFDFRPYARMVFSANSCPTARDSDQAFHDRWLVVRFDRSFRGTGREVDSDKLDARLSSPDERSGLLNHALSVLSDLVKKHAFTTSSRMLADGKKYQAIADPLAAYLEREVEQADGCSIPVESLYTAYASRCRANGIDLIMPHIFSLRVHRLTGSKTIRRSISGSGRVRCFLGIRKRAAR